MVTSGQPIAAFDVDGTLVDGQTQAMLVRYMRERGMLDTGTVVAAAVWFLAYKMGFPLSGDRVRRRVLGSFRGMTMAQIDEVVDALHATRLRARVSAGGCDVIRQYESEGTRTVLVSASVEPIVSRIARQVGASHWIATTLGSCEGRMTGAVSGLVVEGKAKAERFTKWADETYGEWTLVAAYGDHETDAELLALAESPFAVNPTRALRKVAGENGWSCVEWSSDRGGR